MNIDFLHNQIISDTISNKFIESFNENFVPKLMLEYGSELEQIQFYEDHLKSGFRINGEFFYPLTVVSGGEAFTRWIKWPVANYRHYDNFNPYSYKGKKLLEFDFAEQLPSGLEEKIAGKPIYAPEGPLPVIISSASTDKTFLAGKYSQGFVDELAASITARIEEELDINGLAESGIVLELSFLPGTFMEHIVENTTYRRILIKARGCNARDLWIKWIRLDGEGTYSFADNVFAGDIVFDLAEDVPGKIREKEYRYLTAESVEKYQTAMSRKNITEWRDMMRRVVRRGEVEKLTEDVTEEIEETDKEDLAVEIVAQEPVIEETVLEDVAEPEIEVEITEIEELVDEDAIEESSDGEEECSCEEEDTVDEDSAFEEACECEEESEENFEEEPEEESEANFEDESEDEPEEVEDDLAAMLAQTLGADEANADDEQEPVEAEEEAGDDMDSDLADLLKSAIGIVAEAAEKGGEDVLVAEMAAAGLIETPVEDLTEAVKAEKEATEKVDAAELEAKIREELEAKIREEIMLEMQAKNDEAARLREELEAKQRAEEREKALMAEAALAAIEAQQKLERQREEEARIRAEEEARIAEERKREEEAARIKAEREAEEARIKAEMEARAKAEADAKAEAEKNLMGDVKYVSKTAKLFFKNNVDSGITKRIHEIILATIKYFHKEDVYIRIKATVPDSTTVNLQFVQIPEDELQLLVNIIKVLGRSELGIVKATID